MVICSLRRGFYPETDRFFVAVKPWSSTGSARIRFENRPSGECGGGGIYPPLFLGNKKLNAWRINIATWPILKWQHEYNKFIEFIFVLRLGFFRFVLIKFRQSLRKKNSVALFDEHGEYLISCNLDNSILSFREECSNHGPTIRITLDSVETLVSKSSRFECAAIMLHNWIFLYGTCKRRD